MRYWFDTEFIERGPEYPIRLLSIGILSEDGREFYAEVPHADGLIHIDRDNFGDPWLSGNVLPHLQGEVAWMPRPLMSAAIQQFCNPENHANPKPEFWAYYADYDWVVLCQIFGRMIDLPKGWPMYCRDIKQWADSLGNPKLPENRGAEHHALADAIWNRSAWLFLESVQRLENGDRE